MIKTVLFDLDGTLLNTIDDLADAGNWVCAQNGWPTFTVAQFKLMVGNGIPKLVERFSPADARTPAQLAATLAQFTARYDAHKEDKTAPYPGIPALLDALKAEGIQCAVFSNKADALCGGIIAHYFGTERFDAVRGSRPGVPTKPDPTGVYSLMQDLHADPASTLFVGDSETKAAIEAKCAPDCVEMEGAAVSQIAAKNGVPCVILRAMSDNADESGYEVLVVKKFSIGEYIKTATAIVANMIEAL